METTTNNQAEAQVRSTLAQEARKRRDEAEAYKQDCAAGNGHWSQSDETELRCAQMLARRYRV